MKYTIRTALISDIPEIEALIDQSVRVLAIKDYTKEQIEGALVSAWGVDTQLINDNTYFVVEIENQLIGCGGWSYRETLFGNDNEAARSLNTLNPNKSPAKIRAFFVKPIYSRQGIGTTVMLKCEEAARTMGFSRLELMATLPGKKLYIHHGFIASDAIEYSLGNDLSITFIPMSKELKV